MPIAKLRLKILCLFSAWMVVFHLTAQGFAPGTVLCMQANGQVEVEIPGVGRSCADQAVPPHSQVEAALLVVQFSSDTDCGPCADLLLPDASAAEGRAGRLFDAAGPLVLAWQQVAPAWDSLPSLHLAIAALYGPSPPSLPPVHLRRTTVLLI